MTCLTLDLVLLSLTLVICAGGCGILLGHADKLRRERDAAIELAAHLPGLRAEALDMWLCMTPHAREKAIFSIYLPTNETGRPMTLYQLSLKDAAYFRQLRFGK